MHRCPFCRLVMPPVPEAIDAGWEPTYYDGGRDTGEPVCPDCTAAHLREGDDGEMEVREKGKAYLYP